jgi:DNA-binding transcriptional LysR family regulator
MRNLDTSALRALVAVAEMGGVTRAAAQLNLTQSAVSLQIKRLEETLDRCLFDRVGRGVVLTVAGEELVGYARRLLAVNDEIVVRLGQAGGADGDIRFGVPCDIVNFHVPQAIRSFSLRHPETRLTLRTEVSGLLREQCEAGSLDLILTTESEPGPEAEVLGQVPLVWVGAPGGNAFRRRPLPIAAVTGCAFTRVLMARLSAAGFDWKVVSEGSMVESLVAADLAVYAMLRGAIAPGMAEIEQGGGLPPLPSLSLALYLTQGPRRRLAERLAASLRDEFGVAAAAA